MDFDIPEEGKYYLLIAACSPDTSNVQLQGQSISMNPYGHLSGRMHNLVGCTRIFMVVYSILCCVWIYRLFQYLKELMSIHVVITVVLLLFTFSTILSYFSLKYVNSNGDHHPFLHPVYLLFYSLARTLLRCLLLLISKGLGVSIASLGSSFWVVLSISACYFVNALLSEYYNSYSFILYENQTLTNPFSMSSIVIDIVFFFYIIKSLFATIDELRDKNQTSKLAIFITLRNILIISIILATVYNTLFTYVIVEHLLDSMWKLQWMFTDGVWIIVHFIVIGIVMVCFLPSSS